jgi:hypothetical protein
MFTDNPSEEMILSHVREARRKRITTTYIIRVVDGIVIFQEAHTVNVDREKCRVDNGGNYR